MTLVASMDGWIAAVAISPELEAGESPVALPVSELMGLACR